MSEQKTFTDDSFAIVEVMGRNVFAGRISEHTIGGAAFVRVDVAALPEKREILYGREYVRQAIPSFTKLIGANSIYAITPCSEEVARRMAEKTRVTPVSVLDIQPSAARMLEASSDESDTEEEEDFDLA